LKERTTPEYSGILGYPAQRYCLAHSMVFSRGNALIFKRKPFLRTTKDRLADPSEICVLDFKGEFRRFGNPSVPTTIANDWSIFLARPA
jgi:hypothetical protein